MKTLSAPASIATLSALLAVAVHPALGADRGLPWSPAVVAGLALLLATALAVRALAEPTPGSHLIALGATALVAALGYDAVAGWQGTLSIAPGQGRHVFEEEAPGGRSLGLRPLGFDVRLDRFEPDGAATLSCFEDDLVKAVLTVRRDQAAHYGGFRFAGPAAVHTGEASSLRIIVSGPSGTEDVQITPGEAARAGDLEIALERYFADFALDDRQQPRSRSEEPRNPAALLRVHQGQKTWRVFVLRSMPALHRPEGLDRSFSLTAVEPEILVRIAVSRQPAGPLAMVGAIASALGLAVASRRHP